MKKAWFYILLFTLLGCASVSFEVKELKSNELMGRGYDHLNGRLYSIFCGGNAYASANYVEESCLKNISEFAYNKGYDYFSVLASQGNTEKLPYLDKYGTTYIVKQGLYYSILLTNSWEIDNLKNYYIVSDYYNKKKEDEEKTKERLDKEWNSFNGY